MKNPASWGADLVGLALAEDLGNGDVTARFFVPEERRARARAVAREDCTVAGLGAFRDVFTRVDADGRVGLLHRDGDRIGAGAVVAEVEGPARSLLAAERVALNFLQHLSGVATAASRYVDAVQGTGVRILDTRKTTPGMRALEKAAAAAGGATNHRMGLDDRILVKDNHLAGTRRLGEIAQAVRAAKAENLVVEIEVDTLDQFAAVVAIPGVDAVLLDNMSTDELREAVRRRPPGITLEASGGVTLETVRAIAETGVDFISIGAITHSAPAVDFGLDFEPVAGGLECS